MPMMRDWVMGRMGGCHCRGQANCPCHRSPAPVGGDDDGPTPMMMRFGCSCAGQANCPCHKSPSPQPAEPPAEPEPQVVLKGGEQPGAGAQA